MVEPMIALRRWLFALDAERAKRASSTFMLVVLACAAGQAFALTYEENLDDNAELATDLRLQRLDMRMQRQVQREAEIRKQYAAIESAIERGKALAAEVKEKQRLFNAAAGSPTVRAALGEGAPRGLAWHCSRAREILPQLSRLATSAGAAFTDYSAQLRAIPVGSDGGAAALQAQHARLQAAVAGPLEPEEQQRLHADLKEIELSLPHAWGSYTTLRQMANETNDKSDALIQAIAAMGQLADAIEKQIPKYVDEQRIIRETLDVIDPEYAAEAALRNSIDKRWSATRLPGLKNASPFDIVSSARFFVGPWQAAAGEAQGAVQAGLRPFPDAVSACRDWEQPPRDFAAARAAAERPLDEQFIRIDEAYAARAEQIRQARITAEDVSRISQETVADLDRKIATVQERGRQIAPGDAAGQEKLRALLEKGNRLRSEAAIEVGRMERAMAMLDTEGRVVEEQRAATSGMKAGLLLAQGNSAGE